MGLVRVPAGDSDKIPHEVNVVIEIPAYSNPIKYELDKKSGAMFVDRFLNTSMHYPCNYGYVPNTLSEDGDPVDVLVITPFRLVVGVVIPVRPIGVLKMTDEAGCDAKVLALPTDSLTTMYQHITKPNDLPQTQLDAICHFFEHYKDLEPDKWVKIEGWDGPEAAYKEITDSIARFK